MKLTFTKMHGAGNDFIVIDAINQQIDFTPIQWQALADRRFGIGADQLLVVEKPQAAGVDFRYRIYNADGGEVEQCGNGARAFVKFVTEKGLTAKRTIKVETMCGVIEPMLEDDGSITVDMGAPVLTPANVPFDASALQAVHEGADTLWPLEINGQRALFSVVSMGNPHAIQVVGDTEAAPVQTDGPLIEHHRRFPKRVNAGFMQIVDRHQIKLRVFERGAGETLACGTGACAAVVAGIQRDLLDSPVKVQMHGGELLIAWDGIDQPVRLTGPAVTVFEGVIDIAMSAKILPK
ncbi:diaminopimelate epimerase [Glaciimonas sp. GG7]